MASAPGEFNVLDPPADYSGAAWDNSYGAANDTALQNTAAYLAASTLSGTPNSPRVLFVPPGSYKFVSLNANKFVGIEGLRIQGGGLQRAQNQGGGNTGRQTSRWIYDADAGGTAGYAFKFDNCSGLVLDGINLHGKGASGTALVDTVLEMDSSFSGQNLGYIHILDSCVADGVVGIDWVGGDGIVLVDMVMFRQLTSGYKLSNGNQVNHELHHCHWAFTYNAVEFAGSAGQLLINYGAGAFVKRILKGDATANTGCVHVYKWKNDHAEKRRRTVLCQQSNPATQGVWSFTGVIDSSGQDVRGDNDNDDCEITQGIVAPTKCRLLIESNFEGAPAGATLALEAGDKIIVKGFSEATYNTTHTIVSVESQNDGRSPPWAIVETNIDYQGVEGPVGTWIDGNPRCDIKGGCELVLSECQFEYGACDERRLVRSQPGIAGGFTRQNSIVVERCTGLGTARDDVEGLILELVPGASGAVSGHIDWYAFRDMFPTYSSLLPPWSATNHPETSGMDWSDTEKAYIRSALGIPGSATPIVSPELSLKTDVDAVITQGDAAWTTADLSAVTADIAALVGRTFSPTEIAELRQILGLSTRTGDPPLTAYHIKSLLGRLRQVMAAVNGTTIGVGPASNQETYRDENGNTAFVANFDGNKNRTNVVRSNPVSP